MCSTSIKFRPDHIGLVKLGWAEDLSDKEKLNLVSLEFYGDDETKLQEISCGLAAVAKQEELRLGSRNHIVGVKLAHGDEKFRSLTFRIA